MLRRSVFRIKEAHVEVKQKASHPRKTPDRSSQDEIIEIARLRFMLQRVLLVRTRPLAASHSSRLGVRCYLHDDSVTAQDGMRRPNACWN